MSSIHHCLSGLPWWCKSSTLPSKTVSAKFPALPLVTCPKYCSFIRATFPINSLSRQSLLILIYWYGVLSKKFRASFCHLHVLLENSAVAFRSFPHRRMKPFSSSPSGFLKYCWPLCSSSAIQVPALLLPKAWVLFRSCPSPRQTAWQG